MHILPQVSGPAPSLPRISDMTTAITDLPAVNALVRVSLGDADSPDVSQLASRVPSRVEDVLPAPAGSGAPRLLVAAPQFEGDLELPAPGARCTVQWTSPYGLWVLPVAFRDGRRACTVGVWELDVVGAARREERRKFVRVAWSLPVELELRPGDDLAAEVRELLTRAAGGELPDGRLVVHGSTVNLGEGGLLGLLRDVKLPGECPVIVRITVNGTDFAVPSRICWSLATGTDPVRYETALAFDDPTRYGDVLRPMLYGEQIRQRREGLA
jgi:hypothetical protein